MKSFLFTVIALGAFSMPSYSACDNGLAGQNLYEVYLSPNDPAYDYTVFQMPGMKNGLRLGSQRMGPECNAAIGMTMTALHELPEDCKIMIGESRETQFSISTCVCSNQGCTEEVTKKL